MAAEPRAEITVTRSIKVRVGGPLDRRAEASLERILTDLLLDQGVSELLVDLTEVSLVDPAVTELFERAERMAGASNCRLELRVPSPPPPALVAAAPDLPTFVQLDRGSSARSDDDSGRTASP